MEPSDTNFDQSEAEIASVDVIDSESVGAEESDGQCYFDIGEYLRKLIEIKCEFNKFCFHDQSISDEFNLEKEMKESKSRYYSELSALDESKASQVQMLQKKIDLENELLSSIGRIITHSKEQVEVCEEIKSAFAAIEKLSLKKEEKVREDTRENALAFAELANEGIDLYGYTNEPDKVKKINTHADRSATDIATESIMVLKFLGEKGPYNSYDGQIDEVRKALADLNGDFEKTNCEYEALNKEDHELSKEIERVKEMIRISEQEKAAEKEKAAVEKRSFGNKLTEMVKANTEKYQQYITMGQQIALMKEELRELPSYSETLKELEAAIKEKKDRLPLVRDEIEKAKEANNTMMNEIQIMKSKSELMENEHDEKVKEMRSTLSRLENELFDEQEVLKEFEASKLKAQREFDSSQAQLEKIQAEFDSLKDEARRKKAEKKKKLREKRALKNQLEKEKMQMEFKLTMGLPF